MGVKIPHPNTPLPAGDRWCDRLWWLMEVHGTGVSELAREVGRSKSCISAFASGKNEPTIGLVIAVCQHYGVSADFLLGFTDNPKGGMTYQPRTDDRQTGQRSYRWPDPERQEQDQFPHRGSPAV